MDYYTVPEWFYVLSLFSIAAVVLSMLTLSCVPKNEINATAAMTAKKAIDYSLRTLSSSRVGIGGLARGMRFRGS